MRKTIILLTCVLMTSLVGICEQSRSFIDVGLHVPQANKSKEKVILLSSSEWFCLRETINTNGWCKIVKDNTILIVINSLSNVEKSVKLLPSLIDLSHPDKKTEKISEPKTIFISK